MQLLDPSTPGLFRIVPAGQAVGPQASPPAGEALPPAFVGMLGAPAAGAPSQAAKTSDVLRYWRHEFRTYKEKHRRLDGFQPDDDTDWHADGSRHTDHDTIVVAVRGTLANGATPTPGATPPFRLVISSSGAPLQ
jgi:hypothetical protein